GAKAPVTKHDQDEINSGKGNLTVSAGLGVNAKGSTELIVNITNNGNSSVFLPAVSLHGQFNVSFTTPVASCGPNQGKQGNNQNSSEGQGENGSQGTQTGSSNSGNNSQDAVLADQSGCQNQSSHEFEHPDQIVFLTNQTTCQAVAPVTSTTTTTTSTQPSTTTTTVVQHPKEAFKCAISVAGSQGDDNNDQGNDNSQSDESTAIMIQPNQTYTLVYGPSSITLGNSHVQITSIANDSYTLHIIASNGAGFKCSVTAQSTLPPTLKACTPISDNHDGGNSQGQDGGTDSFVATLVKLGDRLTLL
ncbi:MAG: hypothetical protein QXI37_04465, partial [Thermoprotei archaeon]